MLFSSISFLYYFLPLVIIIYYLTPSKYKNFILLGSSLLFYFYGESIFIVIMLGQTFSGYIHGVFIERSKKRRTQKILLISSLVTGGFFLVLFKYTDFIFENLNHIGAGLPLLRLGLPLGISFYTFQILSYTVDVYRGNVPAQKNFLKFSTYVTLFPQLIAGPIVRYSTIAENLEKREHSFNDFAYGVKRFVIGLAKKVLIANVLANFGVAFNDANEKSIIFYWVYYFVFILQLYFDFSGYSDMAIGMGRIFGFRLLENFNYPLISQSLTEFWRRWHISLGTWLRDYIYIPMGGNRVKFARWVLNIAVVWMFTGLWHGAGWNFVFWGFYFAVMLILEKLFIKNILDKLPKFLNHLYFAFFITFSFVFFDSSGIAGIISNLQAMFGFSRIPLYNFESIYHIKSYLVIILIAIFAATPAPSMLIRNIREKKNLFKLINLTEPAFYLSMVITVTAFLVDGSFNPFLYFRF